MKKVYSLLLAFTAILLPTAAVAQVTDVANFDLKGKVKTLYYNDDTDDVEYTFNEKGELIKYGDYDKFAINRNADGRISEILLNPVDPNLKISFTYNPDGTVAEENSFILFKYSYSADGHRVKAVTTDSDDVATFVYTNLSYDEKGNWTKRKIKEDNLSPSFETRRIIYYE